jgi:hypothetical protein
VSESPFEFAANSGLTEKDLPQHYKDFGEAFAGFIRDRGITERNWTLAQLHELRELAREYGLQIDYDGNITEIPKVAQ